MTPSINNPNLTGLNLPQPLVDAMRQTSTALLELQTAISQLSALDRVPSPLTASATGQTLTTTYANATGMTFNFTKMGLWLVTADMNFIDSPTDLSMRAQLVVNSTVQVGSIQADAGSPTGSANIQASRTWVVRSITGNEAVNVQVKKQSGAAGSTITLLSIVTAIWYSA